MSINQFVSLLLILSVLNSKNYGLAGPVQRRPNSNPVQRKSDRDRSSESDKYLVEYDPNDENFGPFLSSDNIEYYRAPKGVNFTVRCPGANENTMVEILVWHLDTLMEMTIQYNKSKDFPFMDNCTGRVGINRDYSLTLCDVSYLDTGNYQCLINHRLVPEVMIRFIVVDVPDPPGRPLVVAFTTNTAKILWPPPRHIGGLTHYTIITRQHHEAPNLSQMALFKSTNFTCFEKNTTNTKTIGEVDSLIPYTVYSFVVVAWNMIGQSPPSEASYFIVTLSELPLAKPVLNAHNLSSTAISVFWNQPKLDELRGDFHGYRLSWKRLTPAELANEKLIRNIRITNMAIPNLEPNTAYEVGLRVENVVGEGPLASLVVVTEEGTPSAPRNVELVNYTATTIVFQFDMPERPNSKLEGYRIYFHYNNFTDQKTDRTEPEEPHKVYKLDNLIPDTEYTIGVKAFSASQEGNLSERFDVITDIRGPTPPIFVNVSCELNNSILIAYRRPKKYADIVERYVIELFKGDGSPYAREPIQLSADRNPARVLGAPEFYIIENLEPNKDYLVRMYAIARSKRTNSLVEGDRSDFKNVQVTKDCYVEPPPFQELWAGVLAGLSCAAAVIFLTCFGYYFWRRKRLRRLQGQPPALYMDYEQCTPAPLDWNERPTPRPLLAIENGPAGADAPNNPGLDVVGDERVVTDYSGPVDVSMFPQHVQKLHADGDIGFSKEYDAIQNDPSNEGNSCELSQQPENKMKNRYLNIIAYDHSRVQLLPLPSQKSPAYINANYIDGFMVNRAYIGTQGPLPSTFDCFWRMIWEQRVSIIVMITNLVERGRRKCDMYWPKDNETYGFINVRLVSEDVLATYTVRTMVIKHLKVSTPENVKKAKDPSVLEKTVYQYHYTNWPDHGTPDHPLPVISFVKKSAAANPPNSGPIVVHCSAGVGRTGTYIVLEAMLKQIARRQEVNIFGFLKHIRAQRNFLVQTEEQYIFIHDALVEAIEAGESEIASDKFARYVEVIRNPEKADAGESEWRPLVKQFEQVIKFKPRDFNLVSANKPVNAEKNRCTILVPVENARVHLTPRPGEDGSDYINASWISGFHGLREFIITQHPVDREDFWKMCWDHAVQLIVMISIVDDEQFEVFWPEGDEIIGNDLYNCRQVMVNHNGPFVTREFVLRSVQDDYEIKTRFVQSYNWPHQGVASIKNMYDLPSFAMEMQDLNLGPVCVVDRFGGTEAATISALMTLKRQLAYEQKVDIYMYAKLYHNKRPGIWVSIEDYLKLFLCAQSLITNDKHLEEMSPHLGVKANGNVTRFNAGVVKMPSSASNHSGRMSGCGESKPRCPKIHFVQPDGAVPSTSKGAAGELIPEVKVAEPPRSAPEGGIFVPKSILKKPMRIEELRF